MIHQLGIKAKRFPNNMSATSVAMANIGKFGHKRSIVSRYFAKMVLLFLSMLKNSILTHLFLLYVIATAHTIKRLRNHLF